MNIAHIFKTLIFYVTFAQTIPAEFVLSNGALYLFHENFIIESIKNEKSIFLLRKIVGNGIETSAFKCCEKGKQIATQL